MNLLTDQDAINSLEFIKEQSEPFAIARSQREHLEEFRKTKIAQLKIEYRIESEGKNKVTDGMCEDYARAHSDYIEILHGIKEARFTEEKLRNLISVAQKQIDVYQTISANYRRAING